MPDDRASAINIEFMRGYRFNAKRTEAVESLIRRTLSCFFDTRGHTCRKAICSARNRPYLRICEDGDDRCSERILSNREDPQSLCEMGRTRHRYLTKTLELLQKSQFVFVEVTNVVDAVTHHAEAGYP